MKPESGKPAAEQAPLSSLNESPSELVLQPKPPSVVRVSWRAGLAIVLVLTLVTGMIVWGIHWRTQQAQAARLTESSRGGPATSAGQQVANLVPAGPVSALQARSGTVKLRGPNDESQDAARKVREPTAAERLAALEYEEDAQARRATTRISVSTLSGISDRLAGGGAVFGTASAMPVAPNATTSGALSDFVGSDDPQAPHHALMPSPVSLEYLNSSRRAAINAYVIRAGWDIPALLEQAINSDLPGELRALVTQNVYDTATGRFLLIPQGSRLVGLYSSRIAYGQAGVQVAWNRLIFPDASAMNLGTMSGMDASGQAGFRDSVDNHYGRMFGAAVLTSLFSAGFELSQKSGRGSGLEDRTNGQIIASAAGEQISQLGTEVARRNLNIAPTIKIPVGYRFNVRVNRDMAFVKDYEPL